MTPDAFIARWRNTRLNESQGAQSFFNDLCALAGHPTPAEYGDPEVFAFEKWVPGGFADAYFEGRFGWEFKALNSQLDDAMNQLLRYQVHLKTPPLLVVSSFRLIRIRTNFPGMESLLHEIRVQDLDEPENLELLRRVFHAPASFRPSRTVEKVTSETADIFQKIVADMEQDTHDREKLARYLNQIIFCLYAQDAGLLDKSLFTKGVHNLNRRPALFDQAIGQLFEQMATGGLFGFDIVPYFDGDLFHAGDTVEFSRTAMELLGEATGKNWRNIEPSIFGTLFERALDASKRSQLGAHYTRAGDIETVVEPVVIQPLRREWDAVRQEADALIAGGKPDNARERLETFRCRLAAVTVLDPACGSGNFLYIALRSLLDLEKQVMEYNDAQGWPEMHPTVRPNQMLGLEINPYAAELARTALWIGYIQWHHANGVPYRQSPILTPMNNAIQQTDAILAQGDTENPRETEWPDAEFIIGNPPFLGRRSWNQNMEREYIQAIDRAYQGRLPRSSDYCCYWFEKARVQIENGKARRAGLLATQSIRGAFSREVLERINRTGGIFMAYPDRNWLLEGANVHISIVGFDNGAQTDKTIDDVVVEQINANLTSGVNVLVARKLAANDGIVFRGPGTSPFDIPGDLAAQMLASSGNPNRKPNSDVIFPVRNGHDLSGRPRGYYTINFGDLTLEEASMYEAPFEYAKQAAEKENPDLTGNYWQFQQSATGMQAALTGLPRYIAHSVTGKHITFSWIDAGVICNSATNVFARDDDYFFGILHSRIHEVWAWALGTQLRDRQSGFRYLPTACFDTFPFPEPDAAQRAAVAAAAGRLNELRDNWLHPAETGELKPGELRRRTLTNLYNARPTWLNNAHLALDAAVAAAYGWPANLDDATILERLLALNLARSG